MGCYDANFRPVGTVERSSGDKATSWAGSPRTGPSPRSNPKPNSIVGGTPGFPEETPHRIRRAVYLGLSCKPSIVPTGRPGKVGPLYPAINRWAIINRPSGTNAHKKDLQDLHVGRIANPSAMFGRIANLLRRLDGLAIRPTNLADLFFG